MKTLEFRLTAGDYNVGTVYLPESHQGKLPVIIYCHGWGANQTLHASSRTLCDALPAIPAAMVAFDFYGCGKTGGPYNLMTYGRWESNLADVLEWVRGQEWADPAKIGCFSISSGTTAALRLSQKPAGLAFVVSIATCMGPQINMPNGPAKVLIDNWDSLLAGGETPLFGRPFGLGFFKDFLSGGPVHGLQSTTCPIFFLQGGADNPWRRADAWLGFLVMQRLGLPVKYMEIEGGDHGLDNAPERCTSEVLAWLKEIGVIT